MAPRLRLQPHRGALDIEAGTWLIDKRTGERSLIDAMGQGHLFFDDSGMAFLTAADSTTPKWATSVLKHIVYEGAGGKLFVMRSDGKQHRTMELVDAGRRMRQSLRLEMSAPPLRSVSFSVAARLLPQDGAQCWALLSSLYTALGLQCNNGKVGRWSAKWRSLKKFVVDRLSFPVSHFMCGLTGAADSEVKGEGEAQQEEIPSILERRGVSSQALVGLLCKWGSENRRVGLRHPDDIKSAQGFLDMLLRKVSATHPQFVLKVFGDVVWHPPCLPTGPPVAELSVNAMRYDTGRFQHDVRALGRDMDECFGSDCDGSLASLLYKLVVSPHLLWLFRQLVWQVGCFVDACLFELVALRFDGHDIPADASKMDIDRALSKYLIAGKNAFQSAQHLSLALDALVLPTNVCMLFPPQVRGVVPTWFFE